MGWQTQIGMAVGLLHAMAVQAALPVIKVQETQGQVSFLAVGKPSFLKIRGEAKGPRGQFENKDGKWTGRFEFDLATLDTGINLRNAHMKDNYLNVAEHPKAVLSVKEINLPESWTPTMKYSAELPFKGEMELRGIKKEVTGTAKIDSGENGSHVITKTTLKISDYKMGVPKYAGVTVADTVDIEVILKDLK